MHTLRSLIKRIKPLSKKGKVAYTKFTAPSLVLLAGLFILAFSLLFSGKAKATPLLTTDFTAPPNLAQTFQYELDTKLEAQRAAEEAARLKAEEEAAIALTARLTNAPIAYNRFAFGNCTYLVAGILNVPWGHGNANRWDNNARAMGYVVDNTPAIGAIAQTDRGRWGHVALVLSLDGDNVLIREMNYRGYNKDSQRWVNKGKFVYIHVPL